MTRVLLGLMATAALFAKGYEAGVEKIDITPERPIWLSGYGNRNHPSTGIRTRLWAKALAIDSNLTKEFAGLRVTLVPDAVPLHAGKAVMMTFRLTDTVSGQPVRDLDRYLGAFGHCTIISQDTERFLHTHPMDERVGVARGGPDVVFHTSFPAAGLWKILSLSDR